jgi:hypothetical protein
MLGRYVVGKRADDPSDHADLAALLEVYDAAVPAGGPTKAGGGAAYFEKRPDVDHPGNTACFFVVREDGSSIDFSLGRALDVAAKRSRRSAVIVVQRVSHLCREILLSCLKCYERG